AHLNIVHRRGAEFNRDFTYEKFKTIIDEILKIMVDNNVGLEVNTSGLRYSAENILPDAEIIKAYMNFGGDIITVGSDAHTQDEIFFGLEKAFEILESLGAEHTAVFDKRKPVKIPLLKEGAPE
ncbi:MAG: histidinol phosphate phosphatase, partial [bacterium]